jgi:hypothetical protein
MTNTNGSATATVETLAAEVRTLMVGSRQVTMSVFKQLDTISSWRIIPFGRVRSGTLYETSWGFKEHAYLELVGSDGEGNLVKAVVMSKHDIPGIRQPVWHDEAAVSRYEGHKAEWEPRRQYLAALPLIVLAGLR